LKTRDQGKEKPREKKRGSAYIEEIAINPPRIILHHGEKEKATVYRVGGRESGTRGENGEGRDFKTPPFPLTPVSEKAAERRDHHYVEEEDTIRKERGPRKKKGLPF